ncbi:hypothetical protein H8E88_04150 [candidate division KSB1 bacterium]|nr:hypothetical protein [candidate division KSB1 bacterium]MBL7093144.1 hypothetical protein [candidate division KSB1 bacterium]
MGYPKMPTDFKAKIFDHPVDRDNPVILSNFFFKSTPMISDGSKFHRFEK